MTATPGSLTSGIGSGSAPSRPIRLEQLGRGVLRLLDVGLVERVDAEHDPGDGGCHLPAHELGAEIERIVELEAVDRVAACLEGIGERVELGLVLTGQPDADEDPVVGVGIRIAEWLAHDRHDAPARLAGRLRRRAARPSRRRRPAARR